MSPNHQCPVQNKCGACQLLAVPYEKQLAAKQEELADLFHEIQEPETVMDPILGMDEPFYYRNKVASPYAPGKKLPGAGGRNQAGKSAKGARDKNDRSQKGGKRRALTHEILCGMYAAGSHRIIATDDCLIENQTAKRVILAVKQLMQRYGIEPYREDSGTGFMRHAIVRVGHTTGEVLVTLVTNDDMFPGAKNFCHELVKRVPEITTIVQNVNTRQTNVILGEKERTLYGPGFILDKLCGLSFRISSKSFYQVNAVQTEVLYKRAIQLANLTGTETVLDAYCGTGTIGLVAAAGIDGAPGAARVIGVDNVASAITDAKNNARHNGIESVDFITADAGEFMTGLAADEGAVDVLLMDPPRAGASEEFLRATCKLAPRRIVYISCNPNTQVRDAAYLKKNGYRLMRIQAIDMFPHTEHVESICVFER